jgi:DMSO reductase anchor subunit
VPAYLIFAVMTGAVLFNALLAVFGANSVAFAIAAAGVTLTGWLWKEATWRHNDRLGMPVSVNSATGLAEGTVRSVEWPHTEKNYLLKEMGFRVARKHAARLRNFVRFLAFLSPLALLLATVAIASSPVAVAFALLAPVLQIAGMLVERWLFFAEARHTVALYYGI